MEELARASGTEGASGAEVAGGAGGAAASGGAFKAGGGCGATRKAPTAVQAVRSCCSWNCGTRICPCATCEGTGLGSKHECCVPTFVIQNGKGYLHMSVRDLTSLHFRSVTDHNRACIIRAPRGKTGVLCQVQH